MEVRPSKSRRKSMDSPGRENKLKCDRGAVGSEVNIRNQRSMQEETVDPCVQKWEPRAQELLGLVTSPVQTGTIRNVGGRSGNGWHTIH